MRRGESTNQVKNARRAFEPVFGGAARNRSVEGSSRTVKVCSKIALESRVLRGTIFVEGQNLEVDFASVRFVAVLFLFQEA
jgi:hypothetical protein